MWRYALVRAAVRVIETSTICTSTYIYKRVSAVSASTIFVRKLNEQRIKLIIGINKEYTVNARKYS